MKRTLSFFITLFLALSYTVLASDVQVITSVDKKRVQIDEEISLTIKILGARGNLQAPRLPSFQGFDSFYTGRTSHFTFVNGKSSATIEFSYILVPKVTGQFVLDSVEVWIEGKSYRTERIEIEVIGPQVQQQVQPSQYPSVPTQTAPTTSQTSGSPPQVVQDDSVFVKAWIDKQSVYPNEQILLTYTLYTRYDTRYEGFEEEPSVSGFWIEDFPLDRDLGRETVLEKGRRYVKADIRKVALFPTTPAPYTIQPGVLKVSIREEPKTTSVFDEFFGDSFFSGSSFFARRIERLLKPAPITVTVKPFPEKGKPASFNGAVGQFRLSASVDKNEVKQNEPVTLKLVIEGEGNIETLSRPPVPELQSFKTYDGDSSSQLFKTGLTIGGKKIFEILFIPTEAGEFSIPPLEFSFFDPRTESYQTQRTQPFPLKITPSAEPSRLPIGLPQKEVFKKEIKREAKDIRYIHEESPSTGTQRLQNYLYQGLLGLNILGLLWVANGLFRKRQEAVFSQNTALKRRKLARTFASRRLKTLKTLAQSKDPRQVEKFVGEAEKVLSEYFCNKFNISSYSFTREWLEEKLVNLWDMQDPLLEQIRDFYDLVTEARYGRGTLPLEERQRIVELIATVIQRMERVS